MTWQTSANHTLSNSDRTATATASAWKCVRSVSSRTGGKFYAELLVGTTISNLAILGVGTAAATLANYIGADANGWGYNNNVPARRVHSGAFGGWGDTYTNGDVIGIAIDTTTGRLWWSKNGVWQNSGDPASGANPAYSNLPAATDLFIHASLYTIGHVVTSQFDIGQLTHTIPTGFLAWGDNTTFSLSGTVTDDAGQPAARTVRVYDRATGALLDTATSDAVTGAYELTLNSTDEVQRIVLDDAGGTLYNDTIDRVIPG